VDLTISKLMLLNRPKESDFSGSAPVRFILNFPIAIIQSRVVALAPRLPSYEPFTMG
jgi:hypothetical protein